MMGWASLRETQEGVVPVFIFGMTKKCLGFWLSDEFRESLRGKCFFRKFGAKMFPVGILRFSPFPKGGISLP